MDSQQSRLTSPQFQGLLVFDLPENKTLRGFNAHLLSIEESVCDCSW